MATILGNGLMTAGTHITDRISALNRERMGILRGPHGAILDENSVPPADREYLTQIRDQMPHLMAFAFLALALVIAGVAGCSPASPRRSSR